MLGARYLKIYIFTNVDLMGRIGGRFMISRDGVPLRVIIITRIYNLIKNLLGMKGKKKSFIT